MNVSFETEKYIELRLIQEDAESILSLLKTERDPIFCMAVMPYYALFVHSCQEYMGRVFIKEGYVNQIKDIRNYIKVFGDGGYSKSQKRINRIDTEQDKEFRSILRFDFMKNWNIHYNLGTYWTDDRHVIGNTQMYADFLGVKNTDETLLGPRIRDLCREISCYVSSLKSALESSLEVPAIERNVIGATINYYYDLNTNKKNALFVYNNKEINLFSMYLVSTINFVRTILVTLFKDNNTWLFRIEYIVTYYTYRALCRLKNYTENNAYIEVNLDYLTETLASDIDLFQSKIRNCMMHYRLHGEGVLSHNNLDKPMYGIIETNYGGLSYDSFLAKLRELENCMEEYLESYMDSSKIVLEKL